MTSALPPTMDMWRLLRHVRFVPISEVAASFDYLVSLGKQRRRYSEPKRFGGLEVDHHFEFRRLHDGQVGGLLAFESPAGVDAGLAISVGDACTVAYQYSSGDMLAPRRYRGHCIASG